MTRQKIATVFGGTGFVGRHVVRELAQLGYTVKVATRVPERAYFLKPYGSVGQVVPFACDPNDAGSVNNAIQHAELVVNTIGILFEKGEKQKFEKIHSDLAALIAKACTDNDVKRFVHISALGIEDSKSQYARTKREGEKAILSNYPEATILRPSVIFGEDDNFFNMFAKMAMALPALPLIGGGYTQFQPVYVGDVADAVIKVIKNPKTKGKTYCLGGPDIVSFKEIYQKVFKYIDTKCMLVSLPWGIAKIDAWILSKLPTGKPILTPDQVESLKTDNIVNESDLTFDDLGIKPTSMDIVLPHYLEAYRKGGRFGTIQEA